MSETLIHPSLGMSYNCNFYRFTLYQRLHIFCFSVYVSLVLIVLQIKKLRSATIIAGRSGVKLCDLQKDSLCRLADDKGTLSGIDRCLAQFFLDAQ